MAARWIIAHEPTLVESADLCPYLQLQLDNDRRSAEVPPTFRIGTSEAFRRDDLSL